MGSGGGAGRQRTEEQDRSQFSKIQSARLTL